MFNTDKLAQLLKLRGSKKKLALAIGVSSGNISDWLNGKSRPSQIVQVKIADYFGLPLSYFYSDEEEVEVHTDEPPKDKYNNTVTLSEEEERLFRFYRELSETNKGIVMGFVSQTYKDQCKDERKENPRTEKLAI